MLRQLSSCTQSLFIKSHFSRVALALRIQSAKLSIDSEFFIEKNFSLARAQMSRLWRFAFSAERNGTFHSAA